LSTLKLNLINEWKLDFYKTPLKIEGVKLLRELLLKPENGGLYSIVISGPCKPDGHFWE